MPISESARILAITSFLLIRSVALIAQDTLTTFYPNTNQKWDKIYFEGKKKAENIFHANEKEWMTVSYESDSIQNWKWYHENGNPYFIATITNDLLQGNYKVYYENGQLAEELVFKDNMENGLARFYYENGQLSMEGNYNMGLMTGEWTFYDKSGNKANGKWQWNFAASTGNIRMQGNVRKGRAIGTWNYKSTADQGRPNQKKISHT